MFLYNLSSTSFLDEYGPVCKFVIKQITQIFFPTCKGKVCRFFIFARELQTLAHKRKLYNELITMLKISKFVLTSNQEKNSSVGYRFLKNDFRNY